uniref:Dynein regulatory complex subunit 3 n=1 Tax=Amphiprion percula TaxID=161767 RepID=A0A3P8SPV2_AMPPE
MNSGEATPTTMDEEFLMETALEQLYPKQAWCLPKLKEIHFSEILKLRLEYKNIQKINNLWDFTSLEKLDLNNNCIEKIQGLDHLINLTWINLSFNRIEKIEGLAALQKLEVLDLSNNRISVIENVDTLENITHFFIANNLIEELDNVLQLKKFKKLFTLNLSGNPVTKEDDYKVFIAAHMPNLTYLNYRVLDSAVRNEASIKYQHVLEKMQQQELQRQKHEEAQRRQEAELKLHKDAFVESLNGSYLFNSLFQDDPEAETFRLIPEVFLDLALTFENQMVELCVQLFEMDLTELQRRQTEVNSFCSDLDMVAADYQQKATQMLESKAELQQISDLDELDVKINQCNDEINQLCKSLMTLEFQLVSQIEDSILKFDRNISDMVGNFSETVFRDMEDSYHQKVKEIAVATLEKVAEGNLDEDLPDNVAWLENLNKNNESLLFISHCRYVFLFLFIKIQDKELKQNRTRISDIQRYTEHLKEQLEELLLQSQ